LVVVESPVRAAELQPRTIAAFDRYVRATEARIQREVDSPSSFLFLDALPDKAKRTPFQELREGRLIIERLHTRDRNKDIDVPDAMVHHWVGIVFVPGATADQAVALLQDYNRHAQLFSPAVDQSRILWRDGSDHFSVFLRFRMKKVIEAVVNTENDARFIRPAKDRVYSKIISTRVAQVANPGTPDEREMAVGNDDGFMWRLNSYWRFIERDGGTYVQCESISLSRGIPLGLGWVIGPFVSSIPRESLTFMLEKTRSALVR
jgi:hypothetical protein